MNYNYVEHNYCKVVICDDYEVTNVQTKGIPGESCGCHLESIEIKSAKVGNAAECSATGTVNLIEYRDAVFKRLRDKLAIVLSGGNGDEFTPNILVEIRCYTGNRVWKGKIVEWKYSFSGGAPNIQLTWQVFDMSYSDTAPISNKAHYNEPTELIAAVTNGDYQPNYPIVGPDGKEISQSGILKFINENGVDFDLSSAPSTGNRQLDAYNFIVNNSMTADGKHFLSGKFEESDNKYHVFYKDANASYPPDEESMKIVNNIVFVQNGAYRYYQARPTDGKIVVPMTSFSYNTAAGNLTLSSRVMNNPNGTMLLGTRGNGSTTMVTSDADAGALQTSSAIDPGNSGVVVTFDCYNVVNFCVHNTAAPVTYEVYNENGQKSILSGKGTCTDCTYSLSGGVLKASVTVVEYFNEASITAASAGSVVSGVAAIPTDETEAENKLMAWIRSEDMVYIPLSWDKTRQCLENGTFGKHVDEFLERYGELSGLNRLLDWDFVDRIIQAGDFGLYALLLGVANYGIKLSTIPPNLASAEKDPVLWCRKFRQRNAYCASAEGKKPFDYTEGGLGIAHWDAENFRDIYDKCGFQQYYYVNGKTHNVDEFKSILSVPPKDYNKPNGKIDRFTYIEDSFSKFGERRLKIVTKEGMTSNLYMTRFANLKTDDLWLAWAKQLLYYKHYSKGYVYQHILFNMWLEKFWFPTTKALKSATPAAGHTVCLQDAIRITRAGNSATSNIAKMVGKNVSGQYDAYDGNGDEDRRIKLAAFCRRAADILVWEYKAGKLTWSGTA
jgi:hypothetical protein